MRFAKLQKNYPFLLGIVFAAILLMFGCGKEDKHKEKGLLQKTVIPWRIAILMARDLPLCIEPNLKNWNRAPLHLNGGVVITKTGNLV